MMSSGTPLVFASKGKSTPMTPGGLVFASKGKSTPSPFAEDTRETASNLIAFRTLFHDEDSEKSQKQDFHGFGKNDDIVTNCRRIQQLIFEEMKQMERLIRKAQESAVSGGEFPSTLDETDSYRIDREENKHLDSESDNVAEKMGSNDDSTVIGRGRKQRSGVKVVPKVEQEEVQNSSAATEVKAPVSSTTPRKRGRPRKSLPPPESQDGNQDTLNVSTEIEGPVPVKVPRKRGRPPKAKTVTTEMVEEAPVTINDENDPAVKEELPERFLGFSEDSPLRLSCKKKLEEITLELEKEDEFVGFPAAHPLRLNCIRTLENIKAELDSTLCFTGFKADDPLRTRMTQKYKQVAEELSSLIHAVKKKKALAVEAKVVLERLPGVNQVPAKHGAANKSAIQRGVRPAPLRSNRTGRGETEARRNVKQIEAIPSSKKQVKVLHPGSVMKRVGDGPRIKTPRYCGGPGQRLPVTKFQPHEYPWDQEYSDPDDEKSSPTGAQRATHSKNLSRLTGDVKMTNKGVTEEMLLGRQRRMVASSCLVKTAPPCPADYLDDYGFPVIVTEPFPPKPLCFLCGSAGIKQLIFCSICCEPYHPFCVGDDALLASFVMLLYPSKFKKESVKVMEGSDVSTDEDSKRLEETFRSWTCHRCTSCKACGKNKREPLKTKEKTAIDWNRFVKCSSCKDAYHTGCLGKRYDNGLVEEFKNEAKAGVGGDEDETLVDYAQQWLCETCAKCRSCGIKLDGLQEKKHSKKKNSFMLCLECWKRRQKGSFCPVCNVCYDDNDYDTRMMECGECKRWVHAVCEGVSEEQYQILSALPESIEFICRICDKTGNPLWLQVVRMEMITGCESVLRIFRKRALMEARKRRALNFDLLGCDQDSCEGKRTKLDTFATPQKVLQPSELTNRPGPCLEVSKPDLPDEALKSFSSSSRYKSKENEGDQSVQSTSDSAQENCGVALRRRTRLAVKSKRKPASVNMFETSDGSFVAIPHCTVHLRDIIKFPTRESRRYFRHVEDVGTKDDKLPVNKQLNNEHELTRPDIHNVKTEVLLKSLEEDVMFAKQNKGDTTPQKRTMEGSINTTPRHLYTPSKKVGDFIEIMQKQLSDETFFSIMHFRDVFLQKFEEYFEDVGSEKRESMLGKFCTAVKEAFLWFDEELVNNSDLPKHKPRVAEDKSIAVMLQSSNPFDDTYWDAGSSEDLRKCSFCSAYGDMVPDGPGRLLWAGINEWIHVNCALWSSEVWEEDSGALKQVGQALARSRNLVCNHCGKRGASVSCCHTSCFKSYHFACAVKANCGMQLDKYIFCAIHAEGIKPELLQHEFQVQRKVYVDFDYIRKKEKPVSSMEIRVFIGSLKIDLLGHILPISVCSIPSSSSTGTALIPNNFACTRLFWSDSNPFQKCAYGISAGVQKEHFEEFSQYQYNPVEEFHVVVNHSEKEHIVRAQLQQLDSFRNWLDTAPRIIDEYNEEWIPAFPNSRHQSNKLDATLQRGMECIEFPAESEEPLTITSYIDLYERMRDLNAMLSEDITMLSHIEASRKKEACPKTELDPFHAFEERLKSSHCFAEEDMRRKLMNGLLDGAVNDTSSEASFSSSSSTSSENNSAVNSENEEESESTSEASTSTSEEQASVASRSTRLTRPCRGRKSSRSVSLTSDRRLRSRDKSECPKCKKTFDSKDALSKHSRSCKQGKSPQKTNATTKTEGSASKRGRGRPRKLEARNPPSTKSKSSSGPVKRAGELSSSKASGKIAKKEPVVDIPAAVEENICPNCKNTYRTAESLQKHLSNCFAYSSSEDFSDQVEEMDSKETQDVSENNQDQTATECVASSSHQLQEIQDEGSSSSESEHLDDETQNQHVECEAVNAEYCGGASETSSVALTSENNVSELHAARYSPRAGSTSVSTYSHTLETESKILRESACISVEEVEASLDFETVCNGDTASPSSDDSADEETEDEQEFPGSTEISSETGVYEEQVSAVDNMSPEEQQAQIQDEQEDVEHVNYDTVGQSGQLNGVGYVLDAGNPAGEYGSAGTHFSRILGENNQQKGGLPSYLQGYQNLVSSYSSVSSESSVSMQIPFRGGFPNGIDKVAHPIQVSEAGQISTPEPLFRSSVHESACQPQLTPRMHEAPVPSAFQPNIQYITSANGQLQHEMQIRERIVHSSAGQIPINVVQQQQEGPMPPYLTHQQNLLHTAHSLGYQQPKQGPLGSTTAQPAPLHPAPQYQDQYLSNLVAQQSHVHPNLALYSGNQLVTNAIAQQGSQSLFPQLQGHFSQQQPLAAVVPHQQVSHSLMPSHHDHVQHQIPQQLDSISSGLLRQQHPSDAQLVPLQSHLGPAMFPQQQHGQLPPSIVVSSPAHQPPSLSHLHPSMAPSPHICPHHAATNTGTSGMNSGNSAGVAELATFPAAVDSAGITYILVQNGNTISAIPANQAVPQTAQSMPVPTPDDSNALSAPSNFLSRFQAVGGSPNAPTVATAVPDVYVPPVATPPSSSRPVCTAQDGSGSCLCPDCALRTPAVPHPPVVPALNDINTQFISGITAKRAYKPALTKPASPSKQVILKKNALIQPKIVAPAPVSPPKGPATAATVQEPLTPSKVPISSPNIAVVRPMENPLQKMSNQIAQIEANFSNMPTSVASFYQSGLFSPPQSLANGRLVPNTVTTETSMENENATTEPSQDAISDKTETTCNNNPEKSNDETVDLKTKSIKVTLKRKEGGDSYSINDVKESGIETKGAMRSLKIKARITSGEQAGTATDVVVVPVIQTIPIVKGGTGQSPTIRYDEKQGLVCIVPATDDSQDLERKARLTHRAVIIYEVKCNDTVLFRSSDVRAVWGHIFEIVQGTRLKHNLPPLAYPVTNISLPENQREAAASFNMLGLTHQAVQFLLEQLPGTNSVVEKHRFRFHEPTSDDALPPVNPTGCARTEGLKSRKPFDMFGWLASKHRTAPTIVETPGDWARQDLPLAMRYRNLKEKSSNTLVVYYSAIHGRGLFTRSDIQESDIIIEYAGELIRTVLSDRREKYYESRGIGCYFFKIDDHVIIDATMKGNAARFINHSCEPNCKSKAVDILGKKHILIFAERKIRAGEELTYDYKFAVEDYDKKIPCTCGAKKCRKYLN